MCINVIFTIVSISHQIIYISYLASSRDRVTGRSMPIAVTAHASLPTGRWRIRNGRVPRSTFLDKRERSNEEHFFEFSQDVLRRSTYLTGEAWVPGRTATLLYNLCTSLSSVLRHSSVQGEVTQGGSSHPGMVGGTDENGIDLRQSFQECFSGGVCVVCLTERWLKERGFCKYWRMIDKEMPWLVLPQPFWSHIDGIPQELVLDSGRQRIARPQSNQ